MHAVRRTLDFLTQRSDRPVRRLLAYYTIVFALAGLLLALVPWLSGFILGGAGDAAEGTRLLQDGLAGPQFPVLLFGPGSVLELAIGT